MLQLYCTATEHAHRVAGDGEILAGRCTVLNFLFRLFLLPVPIMVAGTVLPCLLAKVRVNLHVFGCFLLLYLRQEEETDTKQPTEKLYFCPCQTYRVTTVDIVLV